MNSICEMVVTKSDELFDEALVEESDIKGGVKAFASGVMLGLMDGLAIGGAFVLVCDVVTLIIKKIKK